MKNEIKRVLESELKSRSQEMESEYSDCFSRNSGPVSVESIDFSSKSARIKWCPNPYGDWRLEIEAIIGIDFEKNEISFDNASCWEKIIS